MTVIVTGGAGFIGLNFIFHMLKAHLEGRIVCLDKLTYVGNLSMPKGGGKSSKFPLREDGYLWSGSGLWALRRGASGCGRKFRDGVACEPDNRESGSKNCFLKMKWEGAMV